jgi:hypothetical protein
VENRLWTAAESSYGTQERAASGWRSSDRACGVLCCGAWKEPPRLVRVTPESRGAVLGATALPRGFRIAAYLVLSLCPFGVLPLRPSPPHDVASSSRRCPPRLLFSSVRPRKHPPRHFHFPLPPPHSLPFFFLFIPPPLCVDRVLPFFTILSLSFSLLFYWPRLLLRSPASSHSHTPFFTDSFFFFPSAAFPFPRRTKTSPQPITKGVFVRPTIMAKQAFPARGMLAEITQMVAGGRFSPLRAPSSPVIPSRGSRWGSCTFTRTQAQLTGEGGSDARDAWGLAAARRRQAVTRQGYVGQRIDRGLHPRRHNVRRRLCGAARDARRGAGRRTREWSRSPSEASPSEYIEDKERSGPSTHNPFPSIYSAAP